MFKKSIKRTLGSWMMSPLRSRYRGLGTCLLYHRIVRNPKSSEEFRPNIWLSVSEQEFEKQIEYLSKNYKCISVPDGIRRLQEGNLERDSIMITFDDGYRDNLEVALPILEKHNVPATIYVITEFVEKKMPLWWDELEHILSSSRRVTLSWDGNHLGWNLQEHHQREKAYEELNELIKRLDLRELDLVMGQLRKQTEIPFDQSKDSLDIDDVVKMDEHPLITIGAHTLHHPSLSTLSHGQVKEELEKSKKKLEDWVDHPIEHFAYPFGAREHAGTREFGVAQRIQFKSAFTTRSGHLQPEHKDFLHCLPRITIDYFDDMDRFKWKLSGLEAMMHHSGKRLVTK